MTTKQNKRERDENIIVIHLSSPGDVISATVRIEREKGGGG